MQSTNCTSICKRAAASRTRAAAEIGILIFWVVKTVHPLHTYKNIKRQNIKRQLNKKKINYEHINHFK
jgi:hypothetical protein